MNISIQKRHSIDSSKHDLFKIFASKEELPANYPTPTKILIDQKIQTNNFELSFSNSKNFLQKVNQDDSCQTQQQLSNFKKYLNQSSLINPYRTYQVKVFNRRESSREQDAKKRLQNKILQAHRKLQQIKQSVIKHQKVKAQILAKSDSRKSSLRKSIIH